MIVSHPRCSVDCRRSVRPNAVVPASFRRFNREEYLSPLEVSFKKSRLGRRCCGIRVTETILCILCLLLVIWMFLYLDDILGGILLILFAIPFAFIIITMVDHIVTCWLYRIRWHTWICFATSGAILFFIGAGLILVHNLEYKIIPLILFIITGIVFLIDAIWWIIWLYRFTPPKIKKRTKVARSKKGKGDAPDRTKTEEKRKAYSSRATETPEPRKKVQEAKRTLKSEDSEQQEPVRSTSYGGTFHVSKNVAPLPSPRITKRKWPQIQKCTKSCHPVSNTSSVVSSTVEDDIDFDAEKKCKCPQICMVCCNKKTQTNKGIKQIEDNDT